MVKKIVKLVGISLLISLVFGSQPIFGEETTGAESSQAYEGGGAVGFYGEYEFSSSTEPEEESSTEPSSSSVPEELPGKSDQPNKILDLVNPGKNGSLPQTGEASESRIMAGGLAMLISVSIAIYCLYRKKEKGEIK